MDTSITLNHSKNVTTDLVSLLKSRRTPLLTQTHVSNTPSPIKMPTKQVIFRDKTIKIKKKQTIVGSDVDYIRGLFKDYNSKFKSQDEIFSKTYILFLVCINTASLTLNLLSILIYILSNDKDDSFQKFLEAADFYLSFYFLIELVFFLCNSKEKLKFIFSLKNILDFSAIALSIVTYIQSFAFSLSFIRVIRISRVIRIIRLFKYLEAIKIKTNQKTTENSYKYTKITVRKVKMAIYFLVAFFILMGILDIVSTFSSSSFNIKVTHLDLIYYIVMMASSTGNQQIQPDSRFSRITIILSFIGWIFFFFYNIVIIYKYSQLDFENKRFYDFKDHIVIAGFYRASRLKALLDNLYTSDDYVIDRFPKTVIIVMEQNKAETAFLQNYFLFNRKVFLLETAQFNLDTIRLVNITKCSALFFLNFEANSHFKNSDRDLNLFISIVREYENCASKPFFLVFKSESSSKLMLKNEIRFCVDEYKVDILVNAVFNKGWLPFIYNLLLEEKFTVEGRSELEKRYLEGTKMDIIVEDIPEWLYTENFASLSRSLYNGHHNETVNNDILTGPGQDNRAPLLIGLLEVDNYNVIKKVLMNPGSEQINGRRGIFLFDDKKELNKLLRKVKRNEKIEASKNEKFADYLITCVKERIKKKDSRFNLIRLSKINIQDRIGTLNVIKFPLRNHIVVFGMTFDPNIFVSKVKQYNTSTTIVFVDNHIQANKDHLLKILTNHINVLFIDDDLDNLVILVDCLNLKDSLKVIITPSADELLRPKMMLLKNYLDNFINTECIFEVDNQFTLEYLRKQSNIIVKNSKSEAFFPDFLNGRLYFSQTVQKLLASSYSNLNKTITLSSLIEIKNGGSGANRVSYVSAPVPDYLIGRQYSELVDICLSGTYLIIPLGVFIHNEVAKSYVKNNIRRLQKVCVNLEEAQNKSIDTSNSLFLTNPNKDLILNSKHEVMFITNFEREAEGSATIVNFFRKAKKSNSAYSYGTNDKFLFLVKKQVEKMQRIENIRRIKEILLSRLRNIKG